MHNVHCSIIEKNHESFLKIYNDFHRNPWKGEHFFLLPIKDKKDFCFLIDMVLTTNLCRNDFSECEENLLRLCNVLKIDPYQEKYTKKELKDFLKIICKGYNIPIHFEEGFKKE